MRERLPKDILEILKQVGLVAAELKFSAYVVGGFVRDLLLKHENLDIDIVIEGDAIVFARKFAGAIRGQVPGVPEIQNRGDHFPGRL